MESLKVDSDVAKVGLMVMSSLRNSNDSNETKSDDNVETKSDESDDNAETKSDESKPPSSKGLVTMMTKSDPSEGVGSKKSPGQYSINNNDNKALRRPREL